MADIVQKMIRAYGGGDLGGIGEEDLEIGKKNE